MTLEDEKKPKRITKLVEGERLFESSGYALVKITRDGVEEPTELPIRSTGVAEYMRDLEGQAPRPPVKKMLIKKNSAEGKEMGLPHDQMVQVFDTTDETYVEALNRHNQDFVWKVAIFALNLDWEKTDGTLAETFEDKKRILASNNITWSQINKVYRDVRDLTLFAEDRENFLSGSV